MKIRNEKINTIIAVAIWLVVWQLGARLVHNELLLPGPIETLVTLGGLALTGKFYINIAWTVARCVIAMIVSFLAGIAFAWLSYRSYWVRKFLSLPVGFFKAVPVMAIIIYVILIAKADWVAIIVCFLMCFPIVYVNVLEGLDAMSAEYLELIAVYKIGIRQQLRHIYLPGIQPQIKAAISLIAGLSWKAVVAAEILSVPKYSLGYEMMNAKYYLQTPTLFAYIIVIVVISMAFEKLIKRRLSRIEWRAYEGSRLKTGGQTVGAKAGVAVPETYFKSVSKYFKSKAVLENVSIDFATGKTTALMGTSGRGKTTMANILAGIEKAEAGEVSAPKNVAYLFQEDRLLPWLNVRDNILLAGAGGSGGNGQGKATGELRVRQLAADLEIEDVLNKLPGELSGGMKHRVALGRTFFAEGDLVILDEPFRGLDASLKERIVSRLWKRETAGRTVVLITHQIWDAENLADRIIEM